MFLKASLDCGKETQHQSRKTILYFLGVFLSSDTLLYIGTHCFYDIWFVANTLFSQLQYELVKYLGKKKKMLSNFTKEINVLVVACFLVSFRNQIYL